MDKDNQNLAIAAVEIQLEQEGIKKRLDSVEDTLKVVQDQARDALHVAIGVDGRNGLRGSLNTLVSDVSKITEALHGLRQQANDYAEMKSMLLKLFVACTVTILCQFGSAVWFVSSLHSRQENMREDLNRVLAILDKRYAEAPQVTVK